MRIRFCSASLILFFLVWTMTGCSSGEKSVSVEADSLTTSPATIVPEQTVKFSFINGRPYPMDLNTFQHNPFVLQFNDTARVVDTLAFRNWLGSEAKIITIDTSTKYYQRNYILKFKHSEIAFFQDYENPQFFQTGLFSASIYDPEIVMKNGVKVGMTKKEFLKVYDFITEPADIMHIETDDEHVRAEFRNDKLYYLEYFDNARYWISGRIDFYKTSTVFIPFKAQDPFLDSVYFRKTLGASAKIKVDTVGEEMESEDGSKSMVYRYPYLINYGESQFRLIDYSGQGKSLTLITADVYSPDIVFDNNVQVGMSRAAFLEKFEVGNLSPEVEVLYLNIRSGSLRVEFKDDNVLALEVKNGRW
jgi:hypothetical protein